MPESRRRLLLLLLKIRKDKKQWLEYLRDWSRKPGLPLLTACSWDKTLTKVLAEQT